MKPPIFISPECVIGRDHYKIFSVRHKVKAQSGTESMYRMGLGQLLVVRVASDVTSYAANMASRWLVMVKAKDAIAGGKVIFEVSAVH